MQTEQHLLSPCPLVGGQIDASAKTSLRSSNRSRTQSNTPWWKFSSSCPSVPINKFVIEPLTLSLTPRTDRRNEDPPALRPAAMGNLQYSVLAGLNLTSVKPGCRNASAAPQEPFNLEPQLCINTGKEIENRGACMNSLTSKIAQDTECCHFR